MSRLTPDLEAAAFDPHVAPFVLTQVDYPGESVRLTSLPFDVVTMGSTWYGVSTLGEISPIQEGTENRSYGVQLTLSGIPLEFAQYLMSADLKGRTVRMWLGFLNDRGEIIGTPYATFTGIIDTVDLKIGAETAIQLTVESLLVRWEHPKVRRYTPSDQRKRYPNDAGLDWVAAMTSRDLGWGRDAPPPGPPPPPPPPAPTPPPVDPIDPSTGGGA